MSEAADRLGRDRASEEQHGDPRARLKRLRVKAGQLQRSEAYWAVQDALEPLLDAIELLIPLSIDAPAAAEALDKLFLSAAELLDSAQVT
jgi:hypothetical protein